MEEEVVEKVVTSVDPVEIEHWYWIVGEHIGVAATIFSIIWSAKYLRAKRAIKEQFIEALKGEE